MASLTWLRMATEKVVVSRIHTIRITPHFTRAGA